MSQLEPPYHLIRDGLYQGRVIPFLGSGASLCGRPPDKDWVKDQSDFLPSAAELACHLARLTEFPKDEPPDLAKVAQYFKVVGGRSWLHKELRSIFDCNCSDTEDSTLPLHNYLADIPAPLLIVTTNYDHLIECAFKLKRRPYDLVIHTTDLGDRLLWWKYGETEPIKISPKKLEIDLKRDTVIYKMHGTVDHEQKERDQYVITEDDYIDFLARMTRNGAVPHMFAEPFQQRHFLFLGYGLYDWNLRVVLNRIKKDPGGKDPSGEKIPSWAIQSHPKPLEECFWNKRGINVYDKKIEDFVAKLESL